MTAKAPRKRRVRMSPQARESHILARAIEGISEIGLSLQTREIAKRADVSPPLLFKYFKTKEDLIERIYDELYLNRWNPAWEDRVRDRSETLENRLVWLYSEYARMILHEEWVRIFLHSGLRDATIHSRFLQLLRDRLFVPICIELRHELKLPTTDERPLQPMEIELVWSSHSKLFYYGIRKWVYKSRIEVDLEFFIRLEVKMFLAGYPAVAPIIVGPEPAGTA